MLDYIRERYHPLRYIRQYQIYRVIQEKFDPDVSIHIEGIKVSVKLLRDASLILPHQGKEQGSRREFCRVLKDFNIQILFDVGANIGLYSWIATAHNVSEIFLFEADSTNQRLIAKTIKRNALQNCFMMPLAVSHEVGTAQFFVDIASGAAGSLEDRRNSTTSLHNMYGMGVTKTVPTLALDIFTHYAKSKRTMIKIDVEDAEEAVINGGKNFIQTVFPFVLIECFKPSRLSFFQQLGYSILELPEKRNYLLSPPSET